MQANRDSTQPRIAVVFPPSLTDAPWAVSDSIDIYVAAFDEQAIRGVSVWSARENGAQRLIGDSESPVPWDSLPPAIADTLDVPDGWRLFRFRWFTVGFANGERPALVASVRDEADNLTRARAVRVVIRNTEASTPPRADFEVDPPRANVGDSVCFDPSRTEDTIDPPQNIQVRFDFDGDDRWEVDWDAGATVLDIRCHQYAVPGEYRVVMQARNSYFEEPSPPTTQIIVISSDCGGPPSPPAGMAFERVDPGTYTIGSRPEDTLTDLDEFPRFRARLPLPVMIQKHETTNTQYMSFLSEQHELGMIQILGQDVRAVGASGPPLTYIGLTNSRIYFDIDADEFNIEPGFEEHPVTGVTWYGADAFANRYCLRLPTEAEWEAAARGDSLFWRFPFGRSITDGDPSGLARVNYIESEDPFEGGGGTTPVGFFDGRIFEGFLTVDTPSYFGVYDLAGNVAEWVFDWYAPYVPGERSNPQGAPVGTFKVVRGGSYVNSWDGTRITARDGDRTPDESFPTIGFRTAYTILQ